jgi:hypothetical protein
VEKADTPTPLTVMNEIEVAERIGLHARPPAGRALVDREPGRGLSSGSYVKRPN